MVELKATAALGHPVRPDAEGEAGAAEEALRDVLAEPAGPLELFSLLMWSVVDLLLYLLLIM